MNKKFNLYLMCVITFLQGFVFYGPVATLYRSARGLSMYNIFLIESIFMISMLVFEIPWGWIADRFGYKRTLIVCNIALFVAKIIFYNANSFPMFIIHGLIEALAFAGISGCDIALIYGSIDSKEQEKAFGLYGGFSAVGFFCASMLSTVILSKSIDNTAFITIFPYGIAAIITFFLKDIEKCENKQNTDMKSSFKKLISNKGIVIFVLSTALIAEVVHSISVFLNQMQYLKCGIDVKYFGMITALAQLVSILSVKTYKVTKKYGQSKTIITLFSVISLSCLVLAYTQSAFVSILLILILKGSYSMANPIILAIQNKSILTQNRATMLSIYAMGSDVVSAGVNLTIGKTADVDIFWSFILCFAISIIGCVIVTFYFNARRVANKKI